MKHVSTRWLRGHRVEASQSTTSLSWKDFARGGCTSPAPPLCSTSHCNSHHRLSVPQPVPRAPQAKKNTICAAKPAPPFTSRSTSHKRPGSGLATTSTPTTNAPWRVCQPILVTLAPSSTTTRVVGRPLPKVGTSEQLEAIHNDLESSAIRMMHQHVGFGATGPLKLHNPRTPDVTFRGESNKFGAGFWLGQLGRPFWPNFDLAKVGHEASEFWTCPESGPPGWKGPTVANPVEAILIWPTLANPIAGGVGRERGERRRGGERWAQHVSHFFPLSRPMFALFVLSRGLLVEFCGGWSARAWPSKTPPKFNQKTPRERRTQMASGEGKKERNCGRSSGGAQGREGTTHNNKKYFITCYQQNINEIEYPITVS